MFIFWKEEPLWATFKRNLKKTLGSNPAGAALFFFSSDPGVSSKLLYLSEKKRKEFDLRESYGMVRSRQEQTFDLKSSFLFSLQ